MRERGRLAVIIPVLPWSLETVSAFAAMLGDKLPHCRYELIGNCHDRLGAARKSGLGFGNRVVLGLFLVVFQDSPGAPFIPAGRKLAFLQCVLLRRLKAASGLSLNS